eukprot:4742550-Pyramimonas_sp.AAC.1
MGVLGLWYRCAMGALGLWYGCAMSVLEPWSRCLLHPPARAAAASWTELVSPPIEPLFPLWFCTTCR